MNLIAKRALILILPLALIAVIPFAIYGVEGPPDGPRGEQIGFAIGVMYGYYVVGVVAYWVFKAAKRRLAEKRERSANRTSRRQSPIIGAVFSTSLFVHLGTAVGKHFGDVGAGLIAAGCLSAITVAIVGISMWRNKAKQSSGQDGSS